MICKQKETNKQLIENKLQTLNKINLETVKYLQNS